MAHLALRAVGEQDLDDVEADFHLRVVQQLQLVERGLRKQPPLARVHGGGGPRPFFRGTRLHLHKHQALAVAEDEINLTTRTAEIRREKPQSQPLQMPFVGALAQPAPAQMLRLRFTGETGFDALLELHAHRKPIDRQIGDRKMELFHFSVSNFSVIKTAGHTHSQFPLSG